MNLMGLLELYADARFTFGPRTMAEYRGSVRAFGRWLGREAVASDLTEQNIIRYLKHRAGSVSIATAKKDRQQLMAIAKWAWSKRIIEDLPRDVPQIRPPRKRVRAWHPSEIAEILSAVSSAETLDGWGPREWRALILTAYDSAERLQALLDCPKAGFDPKRRTLYFPASIRKGKTDDHKASLHAETVTAINQMLKRRQRYRQSELLFAWPMTAKTLRQRLRVILDDAGITLKGRKMFHDIRRTSYTLVWAALGRDAARNHCGHSADLSEFYLDRSLLSDVAPTDSVADKIARPA